MNPDTNMLVFDSRYHCNTENIRDGDLFISKIVVRDPPDKFTFVPLELMIMSE